MVEVTMGQPPRHRVNRKDATHLLAGLVALAIPALAGVFGYLKPSSLGYLTNAALYWHFVDLVWIILFPLLYLV